MPLLFKVAMAPPDSAGSTAIALPPMGCGTWAWGNRLLWAYDPSMDGELERVFRRAVAAGAFLFDTGDSYGTGRLKGRSEELLGQFNRTYLGPNRDRVLLATKLAAYPWRLTRGSVRRAAAASAQRLGRIDLAQLHWSTANYAPWQEGPLLDGLGDLYERGLVGAVGLSNFGPKRLLEIYGRFRDRGIPIATLQVQYSLLSTYPVTELGLKEVCDDLGIRLIAYSPLCLGLLTGKFQNLGPRDRPPQGLRGILYRRLVPILDPLLDCMGAIARDRQKTLSQIALNWCIAKGTIPIPGAKTLAQLEDNLGALGWLLDSGEVDALDRAAAALDRATIQNIFQTR
ncbi:MAG: aldo/keto reductase [Cyanophyceae cyanobacterium]